MAAITDLTQYAIPADDRKNLFEVTAWYDNMPECLYEVVGDRFGENVENFLQDMLETLTEELEEMCLPTEYWISTFETEGDKLYVLLGTTGTADLHKVELIAE